ncbi:nuclear nucleic acid-binding protein C1D [Hibiscus syriacus]|uniref:Nuclear nucleic acid-binding protein C1D n=1 Tax=Hibiscus syriacus TaxID=106335 RepID=A0A6A2XQ78_HIBSY|nr:nuclear nucleic acid-binding protein C1D [Hibiscus syriacus]
MTHIIRPAEDLRACEIAVGMRLHPSKQSQNPAGEFLWKPIDDKSKKPIALMEDGKGEFFVRGLEEELVTTANEFTKSGKSGQDSVLGPFYFISGAKGHCEQGQKLVVVVLSPRHSYTGISPAPSPAEIEGPAVAPTSNGSGDDYFIHYFNLSSSIVPFDYKN